VCGGGSRPGHNALRRAVHVLVLHVSPKGRRVWGGLTSGSPRAAAKLFFCPLNNDEETVDEEALGGVRMGAVGGRPRVVAARMC